MSSGLVVFLTFSSVDAERRFKQWVYNGNLKSESLGVGNLGLHAKYLKIEENKYLFFYKHFFLLNLSWFLRLSLWFQLVRVRKFVKISGVSKQVLADLFIEKHRGDE